MLKIILDNLIPLIVAVLTPALGFLGVKLMMALEKKYNLQSAADYSGKIEELIATGVLAVEKMSLNLINSKLPDMANDQKVKTVVDWVNQQLAAHNLPQKAADDLKMWIEAKLMQMKLDAQKPAA